MGKLHEIRVKSDRFIQSINVHIAESINSVDKELIDMNKGQMLASLDSMDKPLIHKSTNSKNLSLAYSLRTKKLTPNLYLSGDFQDEMFLEVDENRNTYFIDSMDWKNGILTENYGNNIFGVPVKKGDKAKQLTSKAFARKYKSFVLGR